MNKNLISLVAALSLAILSLVGCGQATLQQRGDSQTVLYQQPEDICRMEYAVNSTDFHQCMAVAAEGRSQGYAEKKARIMAWVREQARRQENSPPAQVILVDPYYLAHPDQFGPIPRGGHWGGGRHYLSPPPRCRGWGCRQGR